MELSTKQIWGYSDYKQFTYTVQIKYIIEEISVQLQSWVERTFGLKASEGYTNRTLCWSFTEKTTKNPEAIAKSIYNKAQKLERNYYSRRTSIKNYDPNVFSLDNFQQFLIKKYFKKDKIEQFHNITKEDGKIKFSIKFKKPRNNSKVRKFKDGTKILGYIKGVHNITSSKNENKIALIGIDYPNPKRVVIWYKFN